MLEEPRATAPARRMSREGRREQILDAAAGVVARRGFAGTSTDAIARAAGVSQPYVVRAFGGKGALFEALFSRAAQRTVDAFRAAPADEAPDDALGRAHLDLVRDGDDLLVLMHGFAAGSDPAIGALARSAVADVYRTVRDRLGDPEAATAFVARGMLTNVLLAIDAPGRSTDDADLAELTARAGAAAHPVTPGADGHGDGQR
ncbi:TetR/AcrR family transcriptional regulator [Kineococcus esterisolvens]|uniref:TetR/AcrR family transcriptional regulator n=1 Tax=unclassified Kineococcus TaxID=2621656 RepID=UPI003D7E5ECA